MIKQMASSLTFIIPLKYDTPDRLLNARISVGYLAEAFNSRIIIAEQGGAFFKELEDPTRNIDYVQAPACDFFYKTRILNNLSRMVSTGYFCMYDVDVMLREHQLREAWNLLISGHHLVYPYDGRFLDVDRSKALELMSSRDSEIRKAGRMLNSSSKGGCALFERDTFMQVGMYNQEFRSWGPEDEEIYIRYMILEKKIAQVPGMLIHMRHARTTDSDYSNPYWEQNDHKYQEIKGMNKEELLNHIKDWGWV